MVLLHPTAHSPQVSCTGLVDFLHLCGHFGHLTKQLPVDGQIWVKHRYSMSGLSFCLVFSIFSHLLLYVILHLLGTKTGWWMQQVTQICASELVPSNVSGTPNPFLFSRLQISETYIIIAVAGHLFTYYIRFTPCWWNILRSMAPTSQLTTGRWAIPWAPQPCRWPFALLGQDVQRVSIPWGLDSLGPPRQVGLQVE